MTETELLELLRLRYAPPAWAFFARVCNQIPTTENYRKYQERIADGVAMSLYQSHGHALHGFEIKVSRSDFLREMKSPEKSDGIARHLNFFHLVVPSKVVAVKSEVPPRWGLLVACNGKLRQVKMPVELRSTEVPISREFVASLLRQAERKSKIAPGQEEIKAREDAAYERGLEDGAKKKENKAAYAIRCSSDLRRRLQAFEKASGINIDTWECGEIGKAVETLMRCKVDYVSIGAEILKMYSSIKQIKSEVIRLASLYDSLGKFKPLNKEQGHGSSGEASEGSGGGDPGARGEGCGRVRETGTVERGLEGQGEGTRRSP